MKKVSVYLLLIVSGLLVAAGCWMGGLLYRGQVPILSWASRTAVVSGAGEEAGAYAESLLSMLLMLQVTVPACLTAGYLTAGEIRKKWMDSQRIPTNF